MREVHEVGARTREWTVGHAALAVRGVTMAGISHACKGFKFETEGWAFGQILICFGGEGRVRVRGRWRKCTKGSVYVNPAGVPHAYHAVGDEPWKLCWLVYHGPFHETPLAGLEHAAVVSTDPRPIRSAIAGFRHESVGRADPVVLRALADVIYLLSMRVTQGGHNGDRLWKIWDEVGADLGRHWTVADLATVIDVSEEHLRRLCQERLGCAPMEHVGRLRMRKAAVLLKTSDQKIGTIAEQVAYADRFGFSAAFRRYFGTSPAQYRREGEANRDHGSTSRPPKDKKTDAEGHEAEFARLASVGLANRPRKMNLGNERKLRNMA
jgi:AraC-like DNA-binding protein